MNIFSTKKNRPLNIFLSMILFFVLGYFSHSLLNKKIANQDGDLSLFWKVWEKLEEKYPFEEPSSQDKIYAAISGLVDSYGDDHSIFLPPLESKFLSETISGEFAGAGMEIGMKNGYLTIIAPLKDSPAEHAGFLAGDIITHVDGVEVKGKAIDESIVLIRGEVGTQSTLTIVRVELMEPIDLTFTRAIVKIPTIDTEIIDDTFVLHMYNFNESSQKLFADALQVFRDSGKKKLLLDLRNNPGGYLDSAISVSSHFLPQGKIIVRESSGLLDRDNTSYRSTGKKTLANLDFEMIILINKGSASASEIVAGALSEHGVARVVGESSYGKGSVQELINLPENTSLKITVAKWLTPKGNQISKIGITPDVIIKQDYTSENDRQLQDAIALFN